MTFREPAPQILILIAPGFEEEAVVECLSQCRQASLAVSLIGLSAGLIESVHSLVVLPDQTLEELLPTQSVTPTPSVVIVPGDKQCIHSLLADPRVHHLLKRTLANGGFIAATTKAQEALAKAGIVEEEKRFLKQGGTDVREFVRGVVNRVRG